MNVTLVYPPESQIPFTRSGTLLPPLGTGYLSAVLRKAGFKVTPLDLSVYEKKSVDYFVDLIKRSSPDIVGFTALSYSWQPLKELIQRTKNTLGIKVVLGGPHLTAVGGKALEECPSADLGIMGDAETSIKRVMEGLQNNADLHEVPGLVHRSSSSGIISNGIAYEDDLDSLPFPAWDLFDLAPYRSSYSKSGSLMPVMASRGCPFTCTFCGIPVTEGHAVHYRDPISVVSELKWLESEFGKTDVVFNDNVFTIYRKRTMSMLQEIIDAGLNTKWMCSTRVELVDKEMLELMYNAGCFRIYFGMESGSRDTLARIKKNIDLDKARENIRIAQEVGISTETGFIVGFPDESIQSIRETTEYASSLSSDHVQFSFYLPLPGTELFQTAFSGMDHETLPEFGFHTEPSFAPQGLSSDDLKEIVRDAYLKHGKNHSEGGVGAR